MALTLAQFHPDMLPEAAALLAARHRRDRAAQPLLPEGPQDPAVALAADDDLLASRFWPTLGLVPTAYRLVRRVDPRIGSDRGG